MERALDANLLVISDLHLGEDLKTNLQSRAYLRHLATLERELEAFLDHYTTHQLDGRPWRLVINGDMVDFMGIMILPQDGSGTVDEKVYGLGYGEAASQAKLLRVFERHAGVFRRLASFVAAGNELVIVVGNHDAEFFYPGVQQAFSDGLVQLVGAHDDLSFRARIRFCPWFYYEEDRVYVEHGHQYDEYCSFDYQLHPVAAESGIALSVAHAGMRYFTNIVPSLDPKCGEHWGFMHYVRWALAHGLRGLARLGYLYGFLVVKVIQIWSMLTDRKKDQLRAESHKQSLRALAEQHRIALDKLEALDRLHCVPVIKRLGRLFAALFLDRILLGAALAVALGVAVGATSGWSRLAAVLVVLASGGLASWLLALQGRMVPSAAALRRAPEAIRRIMRAPFIVFGHSHSVDRVELAGGGVYINTGTWAEAEVGSYPHLIIRGREGTPGDEPRAEMWSWQAGAHEPTPAA